MSHRAHLVACLLAGSVTLAGCGDSDADEVSPAVSDAASVVPSDIDDATSGDNDLDGEADEGAGLTPAEFCGFLAEETPDVIDLQPPEYAAAIFGSALFTFYADMGLMTDIDGGDMDALAAEGCPDAAAELLPVLGGESFEQVLSQ
jgi:hypothetical protein